MMPDKKPNSKVTLEDLFALKRAERPPEEFWSDFQREFHVRQRAAAIEPRRWWFVLPKLLVNFSRYQMPVGASAVLAVTFLSFREYREPGLEIAYSAPSRSAVQSQETTFAPLAGNESLAEWAGARDTNRVETGTTESTRVLEPLAISPLVVWAGVAAAEAVRQSESSSPSARSIAANLAAVQAETGDINRLLGVPELSFSSAPASADDEPLRGVSASQVSREPLFAYEPVAYGGEDSDRDAPAPDIHRRIANQLSDEQLYDSVRRLSAGGDRLTLKF